jgi:hypothetical protein
MIKFLLISLLAFVSFISCLSLQAQHNLFQKGDIFLGQGGGIIQWRDSNGLLIRNINTGDGGGNGNGIGLRINPSTGQLWVTNSNEPPSSTKGIRIINNDGSPGNTVNISAYQKAPASITFDRQGNAYVGGLWNDGEMVKINATGTSILDHYSLSADGFIWGAEWVEMDCNDSIIYYTNLRERVKRYNTVSRQQLSNFTDLSGSISWLFAMRLLPDSTMIVVAADNKVLRLNTAGAIIQTYAPANLCGFFGIAATPDGKNFWAGGLAPNGPMYKFNIASGRVVDSFLASPAMPGLNIHGIAVYGDDVRNNCKAASAVPEAFECSRIFPNPSDGFFKAETTLTGIVNISIHTMSGRLVLNRTENIISSNQPMIFQVTNFEPGVYIIKLAGKTQTCIQRIYISH